MSPSRHLSYIDLSGCAHVTDTTLLRIAQACAPPLATPTCSSCCCELAAMSTKEEEEEADEDKKAALSCLILSGCHLVTDVGLR